MGESGRDCAHELTLERWFFRAIVKGGRAPMWFRRGDGPFGHRRDRRRARRRAQKPFDESLLPPREPPTIAEATEEGLLLTEYASRMAIKNRFITKILADKTPWFIEQSRDDARAILDLLAHEAETDAANLTALIRKLRDGHGVARDSHGYGYDDIANVEHRRDVAREVARRLTEQRGDEAHIAELVEKARRDAWREIAANIETKLDAEYFPLDETYERGREERLKAFVAEDFAQLLAETQARTEQLAEAVEPGAP